MHAHKITMFNFIKRIGITNNCDWREPLTSKKEDVDAAERALEFFLAWFADLIYKGNYPLSMRERLGERLPAFSTEEQQMLLNSSDFFGLNHYTTMFAAQASTQNTQEDVYGNGGLSGDQDVALSVDDDWTFTDMNWAIVPWVAKNYWNGLTEDMILLKSSSLKMAVLLMTNLLTALWTIFNALILCNPTFKPATKPSKMV